MALPLFLAPLLTKGLELIANAAMAKGKDWVQQKTGIDLNKPELTSEDYVKLKQFQLEHEEELLRIRQEDDKLAQAELRMYLEDVQSARSMQEKALAQEDVFSKRFLYYYTVANTVFAFTYIGFITFGDIPPDNIRFADTILGFILGTVVAQMLNFFYGSSQGSRKSGDTMREVVKNVTGK
jgi:hypothetical protein